MHWAAALFVIGALGLAGMPPFATFTGKALMESAASHPHAAFLPYLFTLTSGLTAGAVLRAAGMIFAGWGRNPDDEDDSPTNREAPETAASGSETPLPMLLAPTILLAIAASSGLMPWVTSLAREAAARFLDTSAYRALVLHGTPAKAGAVHAYDHPWGGIDESSVILAMVAVLIAFAFAALSLFGHHLPRPLRLIAKLIDILIAALERLHSGDIRDYVTWLVAGAAGLGAAFAAARAGWF